MKTKISAIIIDPHFTEHDYSNVKYDDGGEYSEKRFQLKILDNGNDILREMHRFGGVDAIVTVGDTTTFGQLPFTPYSVRKKWTHINFFDANSISNNIVATFLCNIEREHECTLFSFFTCTYNTGAEKLLRLYYSLCRQTYREWDWFIIDDSPNEETAKLIESLEDPRITVIKNVTKHGNIGFNKHTIAMMCDGDYLIEIDHDDEIVENCLEILLGAINAYPDSDFLYSCALELKEPSHRAILYGKGWGWGEGLTKTEVVKGEEFTFSESPGVNSYTIRTIYAQPNHLRCWKKDFYHRIGGHNPELSVLDDQELIIRTFLNGKMTKIDKALYIQYEGEGDRGVSTENTQSMRFAEIQRTTFLLKKRFDLLIHNRILELGGVDDAWDEASGQSLLWKKHEPGKNMLNNLYTPVK